MVIAETPKHFLTSRPSYKVPLATVRGHRGSKEDGTILVSGVLQPVRVYGHTSALESVMFLSSSFKDSNHTFIAAPSGTRPVSR